ncbi:hypothetical protein L1987_08621 [Smallanthus sonchifolius]|uniref:Uncharacterized protein n=1 Tax=Smallanthus sonchifolius TaxID=185202 RepID=A0ACB9JMT9_9ASTR|nr:hypothetical protein L1987_08621 [Smallanthus sonchifolius]
MAAPIGRRSTYASQPLPLRGSRIVVAIFFGILLGCILAVLYPRDLFYSGSHFQSRRLSKSNLQIGSTSCESTEIVNMLKLHIQDFSNTNDELKKQIKDLNEKLQAVEQKNGQAVQQGVGEPQKAGPFGTVKGMRTNPTVIPDESVNPRLTKILEKVTIKNELIVSLANSNVKPMLEVWVSSIKKLGIPNYLVVALDDGIVDFCKENRVPFYTRDPDEDIDSVGKTGGNHEVSGDSDVESMSDGHDSMTAYGYNDVFDDPAMGWARYAHTMRIWVYNSGFFYLRPTLAAIGLLDRVADRLSHEPYAWDQAVFNEELKILFKEVRKDDDLKKLKPVIVHVNYHPDKLLRMKAVVEFYINGKQDAFDMFPDGSD